MDNDSCKDESEQFIDKYKIRSILISCLNDEDELVFAIEKNDRLVRRAGKEETMKKIHFCLMAIIILATILRADDGMWLPHQMAELNLKQEGMILDPADLYREDGTGIMSAIVYLGGGTGEFVGKEGLILTNHHVAYRAIQNSSTLEKDYLENGFIAWKQSEEIPAPGYYADVLLSYEDVTEQVLGALEQTLQAREKHQALKRIKNTLASEAEFAGPDLVCKVVPIYSGNKYFLFRYKRIKDIRIVYAPPRDLGNFGGDIDNWMWPRHTCDFTFLRAYVSHDNIGVEYDRNNVPYKPASVLKISLNGLKEGDFTFVMGYPAKTYRNYSTAELENDILDMQESLLLRKDIIGFLEQAGSVSKEVEIRYANKLRSLNNGLKNYQAKLEGFRNNNVIAKKINSESVLQEWVQDDAFRLQKFGSVLEDLKEITSRVAIFDQKKQALTNLVHRYYGPALVYQAYLIGKNALERLKPDIERESVYQERNRSLLTSRVKHAEREYDLETDRLYFVFIVHRLIKNGNLPAELQSIFTDTTTGGITNTVDNMYQKTQLTEPDVRLQFLNMPYAGLKTVDDPVLQLGLHVAETLTTMTEDEYGLLQEQEDIRAVFRSALLEKNDGKLAPDANGTLRFTYGPVQGYQPRDAVYYLPFTTLRGVIEKDTGIFPFRVPLKLKQLYSEKNYGQYKDLYGDDIVTCFLNTTNVTGGNSGSPTLNAKGEQVGIIFDMTYESVTGDYFIVPELQRTISVDIRYVLFITEKFSGAGHIIREIQS